MMAATPGAPRQRMAGADRREQLLDIALSLFRDKGFDGTTVRDIATAASVTDGLLYRYFDSKEHLLGEVIERARLKFRDLHFESLISEPLRTATERIVQQLARFLYTNMALIDVVWLEGVRNGQTGCQFLVLREETIAALVGVLRSYSARGQLRPADPHLAARMLTGLAFSFAVSSRCLTEAEWEADLVSWSAFVAQVYCEGLEP